MITATGYSKDPSIQPEGIVITFGKEMMQTHGGMKKCLSYFLGAIAMEDGFWMHKCSNLPTKEFDVIYIIAANRLWGRVYSGGFSRYVHKKEPELGYKADGSAIYIDWNYIVLAGPFERCPFKRTLRGFQGFRYCTKLF